MDEMNAMLEPGMIVRHPDCPEWGLGQVQSNIGGRITVNFREAGKKVIEVNIILDHVMVELPAASRFEIRRPRNAVA